MNFGPPLKPVIAFEFRSNRGLLHLVTLYFPWICVWVGRMGVRWVKRKVFKKRKKKKEKRHLVVFEKLTVL